MKNSFSSLGGTVTFKNARVPVEVAAAVPIDRLLLETDAPYLSPVPFRGKRNDSTRIAYTAQRIAEIRGMDVQELLDITAEARKAMAIPESRTLESLQAELQAQAEAAQAK